MDGGNGKECARPPQVHQPILSPLKPFSQHLVELVGLVIMHRRIRNSSDPVSL
ncbi:Hypothetical predicted protein [Prunus dulcis]|uniref:Uncharacterized protein n=1 Tax=Prunus dulcis TaxID=3755 RepID=A0A5E4EAY7_PRUDU|nr:Hypothetical predicted protein [Prunus dulcis]